jgi:hypothetical protein
MISTRTPYSDAIQSKFDTATMLANYRREPPMLYVTKRTCTLMGREEVNHRHDSLAKVTEKMT